MNNVHAYMWVTKRVCRNTLNIIQIFFCSVFFIQWLFSRNFMRLDNILNYALRLYLSSLVPITDCHVSCARLAIKKYCVKLRIFCWISQTNNLIGLYSIQFKPLQILYSGVIRASDIKLKSNKDVYAVSIYTIQCSILSV